MAEAATGTFTFSEEWFDAHGTRCAARVYRPTSDCAGRRPVVVMAHGFGAVRALRLYAYAERFAAAGFVVVVFDYRGFGDSEGEPRQVLSVRMQHQDWRAALNYARTLDGVDSQKVVAWGTSFAGGHVITIAGQGEPLAAIIAQVPHVSGPAAVRSTGLKAALKVAVPALRDQVGSWLGRDPVLVDSVNLPGRPGMMTTPDAHPGMLRLLHESGLSEGAYPQTVAARIALSIGAYSPGRWAARVRCPALVQIVAHDAITPRPVAEAAAARIPHSTVKIYDGGHFDPYVGPLFETVIADQLDFLIRHTAPPPA
ncbi:alpha/beta hydrolase [Aeromicrobium wangtongii]|uniref:Alpha/beta hydrolase n=1 Tax=Aeromicrobium wangtongii TaxID=2969247 RepID=A0ABY5MDY9_9ACTN|nr:alpha/beta hydrolase [Aeromicrobium wangtongii]MCD9197928.1 alpha/beta hydrolase [Aeromicrobium wangtongii]UUP15406.1 alpha/beta hydrolase [Aeromicrobium wangtongii]